MRPDAHAVLSSRRRPGLGAVEVVIVAAIVGFFALWLLAGLPRWRETARMATCRKNLMQIGVALQIYHQAARRYPTVPAPGSAGDAPVAAMLRGLSLPNFLEARDPTRSPRPAAMPAPGVWIPGLGCPSDPPSLSRSSGAPISYRADAGIEPDGQTGAFAPGRAVDLARIEAGRGASHVLAFAERLVGDGAGGGQAPGNYATSDGPVGVAGCRDVPSERWRGDAGSSWADPTWRSSLFNHVMAPGSGGGCIAADGVTAAIGPSSAHPGRINAILMDGSLRVLVPTIDPKIWRSLGRIDPDPIFKAP